MNQIDRIKRMEQNLDEATAALQRLSDGLEAYAAVRPRLEELSAYLRGGQWLADYEADEAGRLPRDLKRACCHRTPSITCCVNVTGCLPP